MKEDISNKIKTWLDTQGYNLEMFTARTFRGKGFQIAQSVYYQDYESKQSREIDLVCYYTKMISGVSFNLTFVTECKKSNDKPWLIFKSSNVFQKYQHFDQIESTVNGQILLKKIESKMLNNLSRDKPINFFQYENINLGYGVTQAFSSGSDSTYAATSSVSKAIRYFVGKFNETKVKQCSLYFPVIVIDSRLFDIELKKDNEIKIKEVKESKLLQIRSDLNRTHIIQIVTKEHLADYCADLKRQCIKFFKRYSNEIDEVSIQAPYSDRSSNKYFDLF